MLHGGFNYRVEYDSPVAREYPAVRGCCAFSDGFWHYPAEFHELQRRTFWRLKLLTKTLIPLVGQNSLRSWFGRRSPACEGDSGGATGTEQGGVTLWYLEALIGVKLVLLIFS